MFTKVFSRGNGNVKSSIDYLLGDKDHAGKIRNPKPVLLEGSPELIELISDSITTQKSTQQVQLILEKVKFQPKNKAVRVKIVVA